MLEDLLLIADAFLCFFRRVKENDCTGMKDSSCLEQKETRIGKNGRYISIRKRSQVISKQSLDSFPSRCQMGIQDLVFHRMQLMKGKQILFQTEKKWARNLQPILGLIATLNESTSVCGNSESAHWELSLGHGHGRRELWFWMPATGSDNLKSKLPTWPVTQHCILEVGRAEHGACFCHVQIVQGCVLAPALLSQRTFITALFLNHIPMPKNAQKWDSQRDLNVEHRVVSTRQLSSCFWKSHLTSIYIAGK